MNRQQRRYMARQGQRETQSQMWMRGRIENAREKKRMMIGFYIMLCLVMHRKKGWGAKRLYDMCMWLEEEAGKWTHETLDIRLLHDELLEETGYDIPLDY